MTDPVINLTLKTGLKTLADIAQVAGLDWKKECHRKIKEARITDIVYWKSMLRLALMDYMHYHRN